jgi:DNA-binding NtrC family response regulator
VSHRKRLLFVDDEPDICELFSTVFKKHFHVTVTTDPEYAKHLLSTRDFDILVTDVIMPKINGLNLRDHARDLNIPTMLFTGALDAYEHMVFDTPYLRKPCDIDDIIDKVNKLIKKELK